jgi:endoglucanase
MKIKYLTLLLLILLTTCSGTVNGKSISENEWKPWNGDKFLIRDDLTTQQLILEMGLGINLGNTLDSTDDDNNPWINKSSILNYVMAWGSPVPTQAMIEGYAKAGFKSLRIPITWKNLIGKDNVINKDLFNLVENVVNWTIDSGMVAMINTHHDSGWIEELPTKHDEVMKKFTDIWTQISERFKDYGDRLMFESMNEVAFGSIWVGDWDNDQAKKKKAFDYVNELNKAFVETVRASGGNNAKRHLVIEVYSTGPAYAYDPLFKMPNDPVNRIAATVHYYIPAVFAILEEDADWGKARATWGTTADIKELNDNMDLLKKYCVDKGIPIIVGEFAACGNNKTQEMKRLYAVSVAEAVYSRGMCPMLWDTSGDQYDRTTYKFRDPEFLKAFNNIPVKYPQR